VRGKGAHIRASPARRSYARKPCRLFARGQRIPPEFPLARHTGRARWRALQWGRRLPRFVREWRHARAHVGRWNWRWHWRRIRRFARAAAQQCYLQQRNEPVQRGFLLQHCRVRVLSLGGIPRRTVIWRLIARSDVPLDRRRQSEPRIELPCHELRRDGIGAGGGLPRRGRFGSRQRAGTVCASRSKKTHRLAGATGRPLTLNAH